MTTILDKDLTSNLKQFNQEHLMQYWEELGTESQKKLTAQLQQINWQNLDSLITDYVLNKPPEESLNDLTPAKYFSLTPKNEEQTSYYKKALAHGKKLLQTGKVAGFTVAGGQGTRLGYDAPKGTFPISPIKEKSLFQLFAESIARSEERYNCVIPWYIMTSPINDSATRAFFSSNNYFGLDSSNIFFFPQGTMPAIGYDGKLILGNQDSLALSPNGHGGSFLAMRNSGALKDMASRGIEHISYWQVDNATVHTIDPFYIGLHDLEQSQMSSRSLTKTNAFEKLGNFCIADDKLIIIEYSDMPEELATATDEQGQLHFRAGSPAVHMIRRDFVEELTKGGQLKLPVHRADKKVPFINKDDKIETPTENNAVKLEMFIFDALPMANKTMILEMSREEQFAPVKNPTGVDSVDSCRELLSNRAAKWLTAANISFPTNLSLEISPRSFVDCEDLIEISKTREISINKKGYIS